MNDVERIEQLEGEVRAALYGGAETVAMLMRGMVKDRASLSEIASKLRDMSGLAASEGRMQRADMLWMAADMVEQE